MCSAITASLIKPYLTSLIKQAIYYKNPNNATSIDLILTNTPRSFQITCVIEAGLSHFCLMTLTVMKKNFRKFYPRLINYRSYKIFSNEAFRKCLPEKLSKEVFVNNDEGLQNFCDINLQILNYHAPQKNKHVLGKATKQWRGQDFAIIFWEIEQEKIKFFTIGKGITAYLIYKNLREDTLKI